MLRGLRKFALVLAPMAVLGLAACEADVEEEGALPEVEAEGGELPEVDVQGPDVEVGEDTVTVPDVDVNPPADTTP